MYYVKFLKFLYGIPSDFVPVAGPERRLGFRLYLRV